MIAIIPAAGHGTRFYPVAKSVPKEMLPIGGKPAIQWIVEEAFDAGADEVVIVTSPGKPSLRHYFTPDAGLSAHVQHRTEAADALCRLDALSVRVRFVEQREQRGLGHAVFQAAPYIAERNGPVLILLGDALIAGPSGSKELVSRSIEHGGASVVGLEKVAPEKVSRYGIIAGQPEPLEGLWRLTDIVEKPAIDRAPSTLAVAGRYLLSPTVFGFLAEARVGVGGEIQLTDAIRKLLEVEPVYGYAYSGRRHDIGNPAGYLKALQAFSTTEAEFNKQGQ